MSKKEDDDMPVTKNRTVRKSLSEHSNFKAKAPRLNVVKGIAQVNADDPIQRKWFEEFKK